MNMGPDDIELGDDVIEVEKRPRAGVVLSVRLSAEEADQLQDIADRRGVSLSRVAREAVSGYLAHGSDSRAVGPWSYTVGVGGHFEATDISHLVTTRTAGSIALQTIKR
jgi:predicted transcriptional regulator